VNPSRCISKEKRDCQFGGELSAIFQIPRSLVGGYGAIFLNSAIILSHVLVEAVSSIIVNHSHPESPPKKPLIDLIEACFIIGLSRTL
jgi:hypothetical protein